MSNLPYVREACAAIQNILNNNRVKPETRLRNMARIQRELDKAVHELKSVDEDVKAREVQTP